MCQFLQSCNVVASRLLGVEVRCWRDDRKPTRLVLDGLTIIRESL